MSDCNFQLDIFPSFGGFPKNCTFKNVYIETFNWESLLIKQTENCILITQDRFECF